MPATPPRGAHRRLPVRVWVLGAVALLALPAIFVLIRGEELTDAAAKTAVREPSQHSLAPTDQSTPIAIRPAQGGFDDSGLRGGHLRILDGDMIGRRTGRHRSAERAKPT